MKNIVFVLAVFAFSLNVSAQIKEPKEKPVLETVNTFKDLIRENAAADFTVGEVKGKVQNAAIHLEKPFYPAEAAAAGAEGTARVQITISEEGSVSAANLIAGDPAFKTATENAARRSKFRIAKDAGGNPVKTEGYLTYNFVIQKTNWTRIAYGLTLLDQLPAASFPLAATRKTFAPEWTNELQMLESLNEIRRSQPLPQTPFADAPQLVLLKNPANGTSSSSSAMIARRINLPPRPSAEQIALAQNLLTALQNRLEKDELGSWRFNLGLELRRAMESHRNPNAPSAAAEIIRQNIEKAPPNHAPEIIAALQNLKRLFEQPEPTIESYNEITKALTVILSGKN